VVHFPDMETGPSVTSMEMSCGQAAATQVAAIARKQRIS
jgi:hypothetical protein